MRKLDDKMNNIIQCTVSANRALYRTKKSWMRKWTILWPCVCFHQICFYWMNFMDEKTFFPPPLFGNISPVKQKATPCSMKVQLFHWWNFVHIHQWNCIHWKFMNDILKNIHPWNLVDSSNGGGKKKIGMNYTWWMK